MSVPFSVYCFPAALVFPNHFRAHAAIWPEDGMAWILLILFYLGVALLSSTLHASFQKRKPTEH